MQIIEVRSRSSYSIMPRRTLMVCVPRNSRGLERRAECIIDYFIVKEGDRVAQLILERVREAFEPDWW